MKREGFFSVVGSARSWRELGWLLMGLPLGILWGVWAVTMYSVSLGLLVIWIGLPLVAVAQATMRPIGAAERGLVNAMGLARIGPPEPARPVMPSDASSATRWMIDRLRDAHAWRVFAWSFIRLITGPVGFVLAIAALVAPIAAAGSFVMAILFVFGPLRITSPHDQVLVGEEWWWVVPASVIVAVLIIPVLWWLMRGFSMAHVALAKWALGPCASEQVKVAVQRAERAEEQVRIDQELHDSIGHMITMNIVQAGAGAHVFDKDPEFARQALRNIEERGRAAMGELDRIIATLQGDSQVPRQPLPAMAELPGLIDQSLAAGMNVTAVLEPPVASAAVGRASFGIVREALTNAARYAPGALVSVTVVQDRDAVAIEVVNSGGVAPDVPLPRGASGGGRGLPGIRDRAILLGGRASAGPENAGFAVRALLPTGTSLEPADAHSPSRWDDLRGTVTP